MSLTVEQITKTRQDWYEVLASSLHGVELVIQSSLVDHGTHIQSHYIVRSSSGNHGSYPLTCLSAAVDDFNFFEEQFSS